MGNIFVRAGARRGAILAATLTALGVASGASAEEMGAIDQPIKIAINEWTGQNLTAHIAGQLLMKLGYDVEYITAGAVPQHSAISQGDLHLSPEIWTNNVGDIYPRAVASGDIVIVGPLGLEPRESWVYPPYMAEVCPGLPDYQALYDCAQAFATAETFPEGRLITYPADWGTRSKELVEAIDLPFAPIAGGSEGAMMAELKSAVAAEAPILMMMWSPHWIHAEIDLEWVEWPEYEQGCDTDPSLGISPDAVNDCGFENARVEKVVSRDFQETWPAAYELVEALELTNEIQNDLILEVDTKSRSVEEVAAEWIDQNPTVWSGWIDEAKS